MPNTNSRSIARIARTAAALLALAGFTGCGAEGASGDLAFAGDTHFVSHPELASALRGEETVLDGAASLRSRPELADAVRSPSLDLEPTAIVSVPAPRLTAALGESFAPVRTLGGVNPPRPASLAFTPAGAVFGGDAPVSTPVPQVRVSAEAAPAFAPIGASALDSITPPSPTELVDASTACETDADCVPDGCHATECVARGFEAPTLQCTADFRYGTLDGGHCLCDAGQCAAQLSRFGI